MADAMKRAMILIESLDPVAFHVSGPPFCLENFRVPSTDKKKTVTIAELW